jgi:hypothetical protein
MTFKVFVGYGDVIAKQIAENLGRYLRRCGMNTFVASTDPAWMLPSYSLGQILQELGSSDILVATCTGNTPLTSKLGGEITFARQNNMPILPFIEKGVNPQFGLGNLWKLEFDLNRPWFQHKKVATYVLWIIERSMEMRSHSLFV